MIAEILLVLAGHSSSLLADDYSVCQDFEALFHPGEKQCLESLALIALRYRKIKESCARLAKSPSPFICALCSRLVGILRDDYEALVVSTEARILCRDDYYVGSGSYVPLSSIRATFAKWDNPLAALQLLMNHVEENPDLSAGPLIDLLIERSETGIHKVSSIMSCLAIAVQQIWRARLQAFIVHGTVSTKFPLATEGYSLIEDAVPSCVSAQAKDSIVYIGRAIGTVKASKWHKQVPSQLSLEHTRLLDSVLPQDQQVFDRVIAKIRSDISEWLWLNVLTLQDVEDAVNTLAKYLLLQNGEFSLSLIREIDRLKHARLTARSGPSTVIREQDLHLALLRASLGTSAQHDPKLSKLIFQLPSGPVRPLLRSLSEPRMRRVLSSQGGEEEARFDDILLGRPMRLSYAISWPLDLFLHPSELSTYSDIFSFLSALRHVHTQTHSCWASLSNAQRVRRRWTGLDEGGTQDSNARKKLLRCGWGVIRLMGWFLDVLLGYMMIDVVESNYQTIKRQLRSTVPASGNIAAASATPNLPKSATKETLSGYDSVESPPTHLDFTTLRRIHTLYLERLLAGSLLTQPLLTSALRSIFEVCQQFTGQIERWGGDILPDLLAEGSISTSDANSVGTMVRERWQVVKDIDENLKSLLDTFYEHLSSTTSHFGSTDTSKSILMNATNTSKIMQNTSKQQGRDSEWDAESRRHVERLLLRLDFNRVFSGSLLGEMSTGVSERILEAAGLN